MSQHRFEFETKIVSMKQHIVITVFSEFLVILLQSSSIVIKYLSNNEKDVPFSKPCLNQIDKSNPLYSLQIIMQEYYGLCYLIPIFLISIVTIYYKSNDDLL